MVGKNQSSVHVCIPKFRLQQKSDICVRACNDLDFWIYVNFIDFFIFAWARKCHLQASAVVTETPLWRSSKQEVAAAVCASASRSIPSGTLILVRHVICFPKALCCEHDYKPFEIWGARALHIHESQFFRWGDYSWLQAETRAWRTTHSLSLRREKLPSLSQLIDANIEMSNFCAPL